MSPLLLKLRPSSFLSFPYERNIVLTSRLHDHSSAKCYEALTHMCNFPCQTSLQDLSLRQFPFHPSVSSVHLQQYVSLCASNPEELNPSHCCIVTSLPEQRLRQDCSELRPIINWLWYVLDTAHMQVQQCCPSPRC